MNVIDASPFFEARRRRGQEPPTYHVVMLRDMSVGELARALRNTGLVISTGPDRASTILHRSNQPPPKGAA